MNYFVNIKWRLISIYVVTSYIPIIRSNTVYSTEAKSKKNLVYGTHAGVDYNLTLCTPQGRLQHVYHGQPYARFDLNPMPESTLSLRHSRLYPPVKDLGFGLCKCTEITRKSTISWGRNSCTKIRSRRCKIKSRLFLFANLSCVWRWQGPLDK